MTSGVRVRRALPLLGPVALGPRLLTSLLPPPSFDPKVPSTPSWVQQTKSLSRSGAGPSSRFVPRLLFICNINAIHTWHKTHNTFLAAQNANLDDELAYHAGADDRPQNERPDRAGDETRARDLYLCKPRQTPFHQPNFESLLIGHAHWRSSNRKRVPARSFAALRATCFLFLGAPPGGPPPGLTLRV